MPNTASIVNETGLSLSTNIQNTLKLLNTSDDKNIYEEWILIIRISKEIKT